MTGAKKAKSGKAAKPGGQAGPNKPDWSDGLKRLYDSVVDEPLPESFKELLSRLDAEDK